MKFPKKILLILLFTLNSSYLKAFPWNNNLTVKTNLGHKFVIKESTLIVSDKGKTDLIDLIEKARQKEEKQYFIAGCHDSERRFEGFCKSEFYSYETGYFRVEKNSVEGLKLEDEILYKEIKYRPIFVDLNKNKTPLKTSTVLCIRDNLDPWIKLIILKYDDSDEEMFKEKPYGFKSGKMFVGDLIREKICKKYYDGFSYI